MDTQPLSSSQTDQSVPSVSPSGSLAQPLPNNHLRTIISAMLLVLVGGVGAYFIITHSNKTSRVPLLVQTAPVQKAVYQIPVQSEDDTQKIRNFTVQDIKNAYMSMPYNLTNPFYLIPDNNNRNILLKDGSATFSYCEGIKICDTAKIKNATVSLSRITVQKDQSLLTVNDWGGGDGAMILSFDFGNSQKESYLGMFAISNNETEKKNYLSFPPIKNLGTINGNIQNIDISTKGEVSLNLRTATGATKRTFLIVEERRFYDLTEVTADKSQKIYDDQRLGYNFAYPQTVSISQNQSLRALALENTLKTSPIYYAQECGLQPTFADSVVPFWSSNASGTVRLNASLTVHNIGLAPSIYLTSSLYGYDPSDWDKIKQKVSIDEYIKTIDTNSSLSGRKVSIENIQGYTVKHIMPFRAGRPCDGENREQYQWVKGNLLFNLIFTESKNEPSSKEQKTELLNALFSSLKVK